MREPDRERGAPFVALTGLAAVAAAATVGLLGLRPPEPLPATAPPELFSAERARLHVERLAGSPRPGGTPAHTAARAYLVGQLESLGLETEVQSAHVLRSRGRGHVLGARVENVVARLAGSASDGAVLLMAHYDSRPRTPGAGDDAAGTAAALEVARAVVAGPPPRHDLIVLLTDGEELGLMGAQGFADEHRWADEVAVVVNLEARGNAGPANMFETGPGNLAPVRSLRASGRPFASSLGYEVYRRMPNDTDFTVFRRRGQPGLNFAFINGHPAYHSMLDTTERLSTRSLQHLGEQALVVVRGLAERDLPSADGGDGIFFNPLPGWLVVYPARWAPPLLGGVAALAAIALLALLRARRASLAGVLGGLGVSLLALVASALTGFVLWWAIGRFFAGLLSTPHRLPYGTPLFGAALALLTLAACTWAATRGPRLTPFDLAGGALLAWLGLAAATTFLMPGASYLFLWPGAALALALVVGAGGDADSALGPRGAAALAVAATAAVLLHAPVTALVVVALTLRLSPALALLVAIPLLSALPLARAAQPGRRAWLALAVGAAGLAIWAAAVAGARYGPDQPRTDHLFYLLDAEEGMASWWSFDDELDDWSGALLAGAQREEPPFGGFGRDRMMRAPAPPADLLAPRLEVLSDIRSGSASDRTIEARVRSPRGAPAVRIEAESSVPIRLASVAGRPVEREPAGEGDDGFDDRITIEYYGVPPEGVRFVLEVPGRWPVEALVIDQSYDLPPLDPPVPPRPSGLMPGISWRTDSTFVAKTVFF
ncbi:MAG: M28 family peptidase [Thermoanaerobaculia bacterium]|nr:M28 family peptidase [Thermoanaerobaculia bacterium]